MFIFCAELIAGHGQISCSKSTAQMADEVREPQHLQNGDEGNNNASPEDINRYLISLLYHGNTEKYFNLVQTLTSMIFLNKLFSNV